MIWHSQDIGSILSELQTDAQTGLTVDEAQTRLREYGTNTVSHPVKSPASFILPYLCNKTSVVLFVLAALWTVVAAIWQTAGFLEPVLLIIFIFLKSALCGSFAYIGRKGIHTFCGGQKPTATVLRSGQNAEILCEELVPGDIIQLKKGDLIPADCRLITSHALHCDESSLYSGHSQTEKNADILGLSDIAPIEQRQNMLYMGCAVLSGTATAVVTDTGSSTELGKQANRSNTEDITALSVCNTIQKIQRFTAAAEYILCALILLAGMMRGALVHSEFWGNLLFWFTTAVCGLAAFLPDKNLPGGYLLCYLKLKQMHQNKITVNRPKTLDKLQKTSVICCDKTGSITKSGHMQLSQIYDGNAILNVCELNESASRVLHLAALCCDGRVKQTAGKEERSGDSTQTAIISAALKQLKLTEEDLQISYPRMCEIPFDREQKTMCTVNMISGGNIAIVRGAPDRILPMCSHVDTATVAAVQTAMASRALRVIAVAIKPLENVPANPTRAELECDLHFVGLLGLYNPPRKNARIAVESCRKNGVKTVMLTGDDLENACAYAKSLGILTADTEALDEAALIKMPDHQLTAEIDRYTVFSGISSESKLRIVTALQAAGHTVLMTGDAIEDIAALRAADVGCTPAGLGTDMAKHASDLVASGGLATIAAAVFQARRLSHNMHSVYSLLCGLGVSVFLFLFLSAFTGATFTFAQILLCGFFSAAFLPLYFGFTKTKNYSESKGKYSTYALYISLAAAWATSLICTLLPGAGATIQVCALLTGYALLACRMSLKGALHKNLRYALLHLLPALCFIGILVLLTCFAPILGFTALKYSTWLLLLLFSCAAPILYK